MSFKLIPDTDPATTQEVDTISEDDARVYLTNLSTPMLDALRVKAHEMKTSELLGVMGNAEMLMMILGLSDINAAGAHEVFMAGMLALADEIDRRIPVPV